MFNKIRNRGVWLNTKWAVFIILLLSFILRIYIFYSTSLFNFSDYKGYLSMIDEINTGHKVFLQSGNFFFTISYLGYFAKYILGSLNYFFFFNCLCGTLTGLIIFYILEKVFSSTLAGLIAIILYMFYTEFMVFSSVFYTPVLMIFLLSFFVLFLSFYYRDSTSVKRGLSILGLIITYLITFFFKPELLYFPIFLIIFAIFFVRKDKIFMYRSFALGIILFISYLTFNTLHLISRPDKNVISNAFIFFGHTNYGGDGGEGSFVYPENKMRYDKALTDWCIINNISQPDGNDRNKFQREEMVKFIKNSPISWINLQLKKFFRTFGVVPETTSFMILYTGIMKGNLLLTSIIVVVPVAMLIILFISFFNIPTLKKLFISTDKKSKININRHFLYVFFLLFFYYIIATVFFGQYAERYRLPVMVVFVIPLLSYFVALFDSKLFFNKVALTAKCVVILLFITIWGFQAKNAISNKERLKNAIETVKKI